MRLVRVVMRVRPPLSVVFLISPKRSSICPLTGRTSISGSNRPVGRMICSTTCPASFSSYSAGVAETQIICGTRASNSSKVRGRLS